jgi:hypothetical protein
MYDGYPGWNTTQCQNAMRNQDVDVSLCQQPHPESHGFCGHETHDSYLADVKFI